MANQWEVKCDDCKVTLRKTYFERESYAGGTCEPCAEGHRKAQERYLAESRHDWEHFEDDEWPTLAACPKHSA